MKGKIYKIKSSHCNKVYYGSTFQDINLRFSQHKAQSNKREFKTSCQLLFRLGNCSIELVEEIECETKKELREKEKRYILDNKDMCVNYNIPNRTYQDWVNDNPDYFKRYIKEWTAKNPNYLKNWNEKNPLYQKNYQKKYREEHKEYFKNYQLKIRNEKKKNHSESVSSSQHSPQ